MQILDIDFFIQPSIRKILHLWGNLWWHLVLENARIIHFWDHYRAKVSSEGQVGTIFIFPVYCVSIYFINYSWQRAKQEWMVGGPDLAHGPLLRTPALCQYYCIQGMFNFVFVFSKLSNVVFLWLREWKHMFKNVLP